MKLLMHMCCAPCAVYPTGLLRSENINVEGLFYNPNIHPLEEYDHRKETVEEYSRLAELKVHYFEGFMQDKWEKFKGSEIDRCTMCYTLRLNKAAEFAAEKGYDAFTTSLLVSPYQKHDLIRELAEKAGEKAGVEFYYRDFRDGYRKGQQEAKDLGLYRQKFCGCIYSYNERMEYLREKELRKLKQK